MCRASENQARNEPARASKQQQEDKQQSKVRTRRREVQPDPPGYELPQSQLSCDLRILSHGMLRFRRAIRQGRERGKKQDVDESITALRAVNVRRDILWAASKLASQARIPRM